MSQYQGYTNHATWVVNLWLNNDKDAYDTLREIMTDNVFFKTTEQKAEALREHVTRCTLDSSERSLKNLPQTNRWAIGIVNDFDDDDKLTYVNWTEIVEGE